MRIKSALVLDDEPLCLDLMTDILTEKGFNVKGFTDPFHCLSETSKHCCKHNRPCFDILVTDNHMPGMSGLEFLYYLKGKGCKLPDHRKAIISGNWDHDQISLAEQLGCKIFHKPTPLADLHAWIDQCNA